MPAVVTMNSRVTCGHQGTVAITGAPKLTVGGSQVVVATGIATGTAIAGCVTPTSPGNVPCTAVTSVISPPSLATKLLVGGQPVVLAALTGATNGIVGGTPQVLLGATVTQTLLSAS